jgi:hypothetical protein
MAKLGDIHLSPALVARLVSLLKQIPDPQVQQLGREWLTGGFTKIGPIRKRMVEIIEAEAVLPAWLQEALGHELPGHELVKALSKSHLMKHRDDLIVALGVDDFLLCLLWDDREELRKWAKATLGMTSPQPSSEERKAAVERLFESFSSQMAGAFGELLMEPDEAMMEAVQVPDEGMQDLDALQKSMAEQARTIERLETALNEEKKHLKDEKKRHKNAVKDVEIKIKEEHDQWQMEKKSLKDRLTRSEAQVSSLQARLHEFEEQRMELIRQGVEEETSFLVRPWLEDTVSLNKELVETRTKSKDLLERTEQVLQLQASRDRHTGNRFELRDRRKKLTEARRKVEDARQHAVHPVPELSLIVAELGTEIARLGHLLGDSHGTADPPILDRIHARINQTNQASELGPVCHLIQVLSESGLLGSADQRRLYGMVHRKFSLLEDTGHPAEEGELEDEGWALRKWIGHNRALLIMVDGHNVLYGLEDLYREEFVDGHPGPAARHKLAQAMVRLVKGQDKAEVILYFDGPNHTSEGISSNVRVEYSGGTGKNRADHRIAMDLQFKRMQAQGKKVFVVSDDREVREEALQHGARYVPVGEFAVLLGE